MNDDHLNWYRGSRLATNIAMYSLLGRKRVLGRVNLPPTGPYIVVTNHVSMADSVLGLITLPLTPLRFLIGDSWQKLPIIGKVVPKIGGIYVDRDKMDRTAIQQALDGLKQGHILAIAPEGTRSPISQMIKPRNGTAWLAAQANVPIVPMGLINTEKLFGNAKRLKRTRMDVHIGRPFMLPAFPSPVKRLRQRELSAYTDYIMLHIARLVPARYHGFYAYTQHPGLTAALAGDDHWHGCLTAAGIDPTPMA